MLRLVSPGVVAAAAARSARRRGALVRGLASVAPRSDIGNPYSAAYCSSVQLIATCCTLSRALHRVRWAICRAFCSLLQLSAADCSLLHPFLRFTASILVAAYSVQLIAAQCSLLQHVAIRFTASILVAVYSCPQQPIWPVAATAAYCVLLRLLALAAACCVSY